jgi:hypothetical protein
MEHSCHRTCLNLPLDLTSWDYSCVGSSCQPAETWAYKEKWEPFLPAEAVQLSMGYSSQDVNQECG